MSPGTRASLIGRSALSAACVLCVCAAITATAPAATAIHFQSENLSALKVQLQHGQVHALSFHPAAGTGHIHVSLNDGRHMTVAFTATEQARLVALARAHNTPVTVAVAKPKAAAKPVHHKLRYVAGGILVLVIVVVAAVLLIDRRRKLREAEGAEAAEGTAVPSSPGETT